MTTWYRINEFAVTIEPVKVISATDKYVTLAAGQFYSYERRTAKDKYYFPTFSEARTALMNRYSEEHKALLAKAEQVHEKFTKVFMMDEPAEK